MWATLKCYGGNKWQPNKTPINRLPQTKPSRIGANIPVLCCYGCAFLYDCWFEWLLGSLNEYSNKSTIFFHENPLAHTTHTLTYTHEGCEIGRQADPGRQTTWHTHLQNEFIFAKWLFLVVVVFIAFCCGLSVSFFFCIFMLQDMKFYVVVRVGMNSNLKKLLLRVHFNK